MHRYRGATPRSYEISHPRRPSVWLYVYVTDSCLPSIGGVRYKPYESAEAARADARRLAEAMLIKNALAAIPFYGAKAVLYVPPGEPVTDDLWEWVGWVTRRNVENYHPSWDMGMTVNRFALMVSTNLNALGRPGMAGNPSPETALGGIHAITDAMTHFVGRAYDHAWPLSGSTVLIQGLGAVGSQLCRLLRLMYEDKVRIFGFDTNPAALAMAQEAWRVIPCTSFEELCLSGIGESAFPRRVLVPAAVGSVLTDAVIAGLPEDLLIVSLANNPFVDEQFGPFRLAARPIISVPAPVANMGGVIWVALEALALEKVRSINPLWEACDVEHAAAVLFQEQAPIGRDWCKQRIRVLTHDVLARAIPMKFPPEFVAEGYARRFLVEPGHPVLSL